MRALATNAFPRRISITFDSSAETAGAVAILLGAAVIIGWALDAPALKSGSAGWVSMKPNDAIAFVFAGAGLRRLHLDPLTARERVRVDACAAAIAFLGGVTLLEYALGWTSGLDQLLFHEPSDTLWTAHPGRMAPTSAFAFLLFGAALVIFDRARHAWIEALAAAIVLVSLVAALAHVYAIELLHGTGYYTHLSFHGAAGFCVVTFGLLLARPERGWMGIASSRTAGGASARRLLPAAIALPPILAGLAVTGMSLGFYQATFALALLSLAHVVAFGVIILRSARSLYGVDVERVHAEEAARGGRERFRMLVEGARDTAILTLDPEGTVQSWNPGAKRLFGYDEREILGQHFSRFFTREEVRRGKPRLELALAATEGRVEEEGWRVRKDGSRYWASVILTAIVGDDGALRGFGKIVRDMTERKGIEEQLRRAELQVIQADKMETVGRLAAGVAHEVKNPLATILGGIDYLGGRRTKDAVEREVLGDMRRAVARANEIVIGLLDFATPHELALASHDVNRILDQVLRFMKHQLDRGRVRAERELATALPRVRIDERKIEQVFVNILLNALQAMPEGGTVTVRTYARRPGSAERAPRVRFVGGVAAEIVTEIEDTGPGVPEERLRKVFEPFFTSRPTGGGTGLGLTVCKAIVEMHRGTIDIVNRPEGGARVTIVLNRRGEREHDEEALAAHR